MKTTSEAFRIIGIAFLQRAAKEGKREDRELTSYGLCNAVGVMKERGSITNRQEENMADVINNHKYLPCEGIYKPWPLRINANRNFRGMLALLFALEGAE